MQIVGFMRFVQSASVYSIFSRQSGSWPHPQKGRCAGSSEEGLTIQVENAKSSLVDEQIVDKHSVVWRRTEIHWKANGQTHGN
jgi:hypothetical protein